jgi:NADP-dependent aldehyde dehydrogenase
MGSINPVVILPGAIERGGEALVQGLVNSVTLGSGQFCTNPGLIFTLESPQTSAYIDGVTRMMAEKAPGVLLNEGVEQGLKSGVTQTVNKSSVGTLTGGEVVEAEGYCYANTVLQTSGEAFIADSDLQREHFGPVTLFVVCRSLDELYEAIESLAGNLTATVHAADDDMKLAASLFDRLREKVGRLILNGFPTGVEVVPAMQHGGPYPATTAPGTTSVGMMAIKRFMRPVAFQNMPDDLLPDALKNANPLNIWRTINGEITRDPVQ